MQTFLPYADFDKSAQCLDRQRLGKQRVETLQILKSLSLGGGWSNHPAVKMWRGHERLLLEYGLAVCREWRGRGYKDTCAEKMIAMASEMGAGWGNSVPRWLGNARFHQSHQSNLIRKNPDHYRPYFGDVPDLDYVWPV